LLCDGRNRSQTSAANVSVPGTPTTGSGDAHKGACGIQGGGVPLAPPGAEPLSLALRSTRTFPDGVIEARYTT
jgi:hypothetical protein